jgi:hypothetical protein
MKKTTLNFTYPTCDSQSLERLVVPLSPRFACKRASVTERQKQRNTKIDFFAIDGDSLSIVIIIDFALSATENFTSPRVIVVGTRVEQDEKYEIFDRVIRNRWGSATTRDSQIEFNGHETCE